MNGYFQQKIFNEIIKKTNATAGNNKFKSYHARLLEKKLDDGWNRMRGKMKKFVDYDAPNSDYSSDEDGNYQSSYSYKFFFESFAIIPNDKKRLSTQNSESLNGDFSSK